MSKVAWARARIRRERPHLAEYSVEKLLARSEEVYRCGVIAAAMGDDQLAADELYAFADELKKLAEARKDGGAKNERH